MQECNLLRNSWLRLIETVRGRGGRSSWLLRSRPVFKPHRTIDRPCLEKLTFEAAAKRHPCCFASQCVPVSAAESRFFLASSMR
jgi:hypothetical protein